MNTENNLQTQVIPYRVLITFDIRNSKGQSVSKNKKNTIGFTVVKNLLKQDDEENIFREVKLLPQRLANKKEFRHLFFLDRPVNEASFPQTMLPQVSIDSEEKTSHSRIYNVEDNRNPILVDKNAILIQGNLAKVLRFLYKIQYFVAFLFANFRR